MKRAIIIALFFFLILEKGVTQNYFSKRINFYNQNNASLKFIIT